MQGLRLPICDSCISSRGSLASTVTAGEVAEAQAPKLRQQLALQIRRGRNCQTTGGRIVRKHCKYRGTSRCCQEGLNTTKTWSATSSKHQKQRCQLYMGEARQHQTSAGFVFEVVRGVREAACTSSCPPPHPPPESNNAAKERWAAMDYDMT